MALKRGLDSDGLRRRTRANEKHKEVLLCCCIHHLCVDVKTAQCRSYLALILYPGECEFKTQSEIFRICGSLNVAGRGGVNS